MTGIGDLRDIIVVDGSTFVTSTAKFGMKRTKLYDSRLALKAPEGVTN